MVDIRKMRPSDRDEILCMMRAFYDSPAVVFTAKDEVLARDFEDATGDNPLIDGFVFEENGNIVGYAMTAMCYSTEFGGLCVWIEDLCVKPEYRGKGIGSIFFDFLPKAYPRAVRFKLEVEPENTDAIRFYKKNGYNVSPYDVMTLEI